MVKSTGVLLTAGVIAVLSQMAPLPADEPPTVEGGFTFPAEWEPHESIWMGWPPVAYTKDRPFSDVQVEMIRSLAGHVKVDLVVQSAEEEAQVQRLLRERKIPHDHVRFHSVPHTDVWFRDMGPLFVTKANKSLGIVDFKFNLWGTAELTDSAARTDEDVDRLIAARLKVPVLSTRMILEGGGLEFNGHGVLLTTEAVVFDRNPKMTRAEAETELARLFGVRQVIWLKEGLAEDDSPVKGTLPGRVFTLGTNGHVDEFVRFVDARTILLAEVSAAQAATDPIAAISRRRLEAAHRVLQDATDLEGKPFRILRAPMPDAILFTVKPGDYVYDELLSKYQFRDGTKLEDGKPIQVIAAASYLNYLVTNGVVLVPRYGKPGGPKSAADRDEEVVRLLRDLYRDRKVVQIDAENLNRGGGGMHCITQQQPATKPR